MKNKTIIVIIGFFGLLLLLLTGCASIGHREAQLKVQSDGTVVHTGSSYGFMNPRDAGPGELANAKLTSVLADNIKNNKESTTSLAGKYVGVVYNLNTRYTAYLNDPELSIVHTIIPGGYVFLNTHSVPEYIYVKYSGQKEFSRTKIFKKPGYYNGVKYDYGARIYRY